MPGPKKCILVTGATGTIGQAAARALAGRDTLLVIHCHKGHGAAHALRKELKRSGTDAHVIAADFSQFGEAERLVAESIGLMGGLDSLIHTVAAFERTPFGGVTEGQWKRIMDLNLRPAFFVAQAAAAAMKDGGGKMIFMSDVAAMKPYGGYLPYCIAKAGIDSLVRGLARSLAPDIRVNAIAPYVVTRPKGITDKGWNDLLNKTPMRRPSTPEEIAKIIRTLIFSGETITGQIISIDGGRLLR